MKQISYCIFSYQITKGMKSYGSLSLLKHNNGKELILQLIGALQHKTKHRNLYVVLGFDEDKIKKRFIENSIRCDYLSNNKYDIFANGYAFKITLDSIIKDIDNIDGVLFVNNNLLIKNLPKYPTNTSWIMTQKVRYKKNKSYTGCRGNNCLEYLFYDIGDNEWTGIFFLTSQDLRTIYNNKDLYYDNMFDFEIINTAIEKQNIPFEIIHCDHKDIITINGIKDKAKLK
jgi:choline kinase